MEIPSFINMPVIDTKTGYFTKEWANLMTQMITQFQSNLSNEGFRMPQLETTEIDRLTDVDLSKGNVVYDTDVNKIKVNENGVWVTVDTTP